MNGPDVPVVRLGGNGDTFKPTPGDPDSGINVALTRVLQKPDKGEGIMLAAGGFRLIACKPTLPHSDSHMVYWLDQGKGNKPAPWTDASWEELARDSDFLQAMETFVANKQHIDPRLRAYFFYGFATGPNPFGDNPHVYENGLMTQGRAHLHLSGSAEFIPTQEVIDLNNAEHKRHFFNIVDPGASHAINYFAQELVGYGEPITYMQRLGSRRQTKVERRVFGFDHLKEALRKSLDLINEISPQWPEYLRKLVGEVYALSGFEGITFHIKQSRIPNCAFIFPSRQDQEEHGIDPQFRVVTLPLATTGAQAILAQGGIVTIRGENK